MAQPQRHGHLQPPTRGAACLNSRPPPPLQTPPKFSKPSLPNLRFWGKGSPPKAPKILISPS